MPGKTEIVPLIIITRLEQYDLSGAAAVALVSLIVSFLMLFAINVLQRRMLDARTAA
jgi:sulfate transport system permease protein